MFNPNRIVNDILGNNNTNGMQFYSVVLRQKIVIPNNQVEVITKNGRKMAVGTYTVNGKTYKATRFI